MKKLLLYSIAFITGINIKAQCDASFQIASMNIWNPCVFTYLVSDTTPSNTYYIDFGDGSYTTNSSGEHIYFNPGTYLVCVTLTTQSGCIDTACQYITLSETCPWTCDSMLYASGGVLQSTYDSTNCGRYTFTNLTSQPATIDYGDGSTIVHLPAYSSISYQYTANGDFFPTLSIGNCSYSDTVNVNCQGFPSSVNTYSLSEGDVKIYTSAKRDLLFLELNQLENNGVEACIFDVQGRSVHRKKLLYGMNSLYIENLPQGIYIIRISLIQENYSKFVIKKFVKF